MSRAWFRSKKCGQPPSAAIRNSETLPRPLPAREGSNANISLEAGCLADALDQAERGRFALSFGDDSHDRLRVGRAQMDPSVGEIDPCSVAAVELFAGERGRDLF